MFNHAPEGYKCPICLGVQEIESEDTLLEKQDLIYKDDLVSVFINSFFIKGSEGHVIIVPNKHYENLYDLDPKAGHRIFEASQLMAILMKHAYGCDGITIRQNNELASGQHAFHYHLHVIPRYDNDAFDTEVTIKQSTTPEERVQYANKLKEYLKL